MILKKLKETTKDQHEALETVVDVMNRMFTKDDYGKLLMKFYRFYSAMESDLPAAELKAAGFDIEERRKLPLLERDLTSLGLFDQAKAVAAIKPDVTSVDNASKDLVSVYVIEGATLGGQVITRHLREHLGLSVEEGGAFFNSYGPMVGPMWKAFGTAVTEYSENNDFDDQIVNTAKETFDCFRKSFEEEPIAATN
jgi:heme oxygenase